MSEILRTYNQYNVYIYVTGVKKRERTVKGHIVKIKKIQDDSFNTDSLRGLRNETVEKISSELKSVVSWGPLVASFETIKVYSDGMIATETQPFGDKNLKVNIEL